MKKHLLFLGPPGAGKGTQASLLSEANSYLHLSTGELLRKEIDLDTYLGKQVKKIMNKGELVSDQLVLEIVKKNLDTENEGWILDGYPRNLSQVKSLNEILKNNDINSKATPNLHLMFDEIVNSLDNFNLIKSTLISIFFTLFFISSI